MTLIDLLTPPREEQAPGRIYGVVIGIVTNNQDPDGLGRVKVTFPWLSEEDESEWARVATLMAGPDRGTFFLPEVDDEVLVAFEHGDVRRPYILGALWNGVDTPPRDNGDGNNDERVITSRSGHELIFNDNDQQPKVEIHTQGGHIILLDDSSGQEKITIQDKTGSNKIEFDSAQNAISIAAQMQITIEGQMIDIKSGANITIEAGAILTLKGSMVMIN
ncbi:MAG: phage baseplate assembly protein V [Anaerolineae bacterium]